MEQGTPVGLCSWAEKSSEVTLSTAEGVAGETRAARVLLHTHTPLSSIPASPGDYINQSSDILLKDSDVQTCVCISVTYTLTKAQTAGQMRGDQTESMVKKQMRSGRN